MADSPVALSHTTGTVLVAVAASISLCSVMIVAVYLSYLLVRPIGKEQNRGHFLRTQFGFLFANLLSADLLQSLGFGLNWHWLATDRSPSAFDLSHCRAQAVFIQAGDVASALWTLCIALHTCAFIRWRYRPPMSLVATVTACIWILVLSLTLAGPAYASPGSAGLWCWISQNEGAWRLWGHYFFVFLTAFGSLTAYLAIFVYLYFRIFQKGLHNMESVTVTSGRRPRRESTRVVDLPLRMLRRVAKRRADDPGNKEVDRVALTMLLFPITYMLSTLPLAIFRLGAMSGRGWASNLDIQAGCGFVFAMGGTLNALLYVVSRKMWVHTADSSNGLSGGKTAGITSKIQVTFQTHRVVEGDEGDHDLELSKLPIVHDEKSNRTVLDVEEVYLPPAAFRGKEGRPAVYAEAR